MFTITVQYSTLRGKPGIAGKRIAGGVVPRSSLQRSPQDQSPRRTVHSTWSPHLRFWLSGRLQGTTEYRAWVLSWEEHVLRGPSSGNAQPVPFLTGASQPALPDCVGGVASQKRRETFHDMMVIISSKMDGSIADTLQHSQKWAGKSADWRSHWSIFSRYDISSNYDIQLRYVPNDDCLYSSSASVELSIFFNSLF